LYESTSIIAASLHYIFFIVVLKLIYSELNVFLSATCYELKGS